MIRIRMVLLLLVLTLARCSTAAGGVTVIQRDEKPAALAIRTDAGEAHLDVSLIRARSRGTSQMVDMAVARDSRTGLTFHTQVAFGAPFGGATAATAALSGDRRLIEHDGRLWAFTLSWGILIEESQARSGSQTGAEADAVRWLSAHPETFDPNLITRPKRQVDFAGRLPAGFFHDPSSGSQPPPPHLHDVVRDGDHWLVTVEGPSHMRFGLAIDDHDALTAVRPLDDRKQDHP
jgi:hypothetical protein